MTEEPSKKTKFETRDIGLAIRDLLEQQLIHHFIDAPEGDLQEIGDSEEVVAVDVSDQNNLTICLDNGQQFTVRIFAS